MERTEVDALAALTILAAVADGATSDSERDRIKAVLDGLSGEGDAEEARLLAGAQRRVLLRQTSVEAEAAKLASPEARALAFEMAVAVCDADGAHGPQEREFLERLRAALAIDGGVAAATVRDGDALAEIPLERPVQVASSPRAAVGTPLPAVPPPPDSGAVGREVDASILRYAILNGGLELLPQGLATLAIVPLQMKMVYGVGKAYGVTLDRGHVKEFIATVGVGMTSQVVENFARNLLGGFARKLGGKTAGKLVGAATGAAMTFATTYAMGQVAKQYYSGGRRLSSVDLRALFAREVERAKGLYAQYRPQVEQSARNTDASQLLGMVRGA
jgi:uncharacterized protein (DUF697 family)/tellurite resistance protein